MGVVLFAEVVQRRVGLADGVDVRRARLVEVDVHGADVACGCDGGSGVLGQVLDNPVGVEGASGEGGGNDLVKQLADVGREAGRGEGTHGNAACVLDGFAQVLEIGGELGYRDARSLLLVIVAELYDCKCRALKACEDGNLLPEL